MDSHNCLRSIWSGLVRCGRNKQFVTLKDIEYFERRTSTEGSEFYARRLAGLRSALLSGLETGQLVVPVLLRFKNRKGTLLPVFLHRAWAAIFNEDGSLRHDLSADAVSCINQLTAVFYKIEGGHTKESEQQCLQRFVDNEALVESWTARALSGNLHKRLTFGTTGLHSEILLRHARVLVGRVLAKSDPRDIHPKHGSGVSACGLPQWARYDTPRYVRAIDRIWPYSEFWFANWTHMCEKLETRLVPVPGTNKFTPKCELQLEEYIPCAKVLLVPKDARGPRVISCEPRETMWPQQGLMNRLVTDLEAHAFTRGLVNFTDQSKNQVLVHRGSITRDTASLDLQDASDMLSLELVRMLFPENWFNALQAARSEYTELPDGKVLRLWKHAPMGSALCFPVMALTIWALLTAYTSINPESHSSDKKVYVYGDDIVISSTFAEGAATVLEHFGFKVNRNKSFIHGPFRESCGKEYVNGTDVTPVKLRAVPSRDVDSQMRVIAFHNNIYERYGMQPDWLTSLIHEWYPSVPERTTKYHRGVDSDIASLFTDSSLLWGDPNIFVNNKSLSFVLNVYRADNHHLRSRIDKRRNVRLYRCLAVIPVHTKYDKDCWSQVFRALVNPKSHGILGVDALAKRVSYKYRWLSLW